MRIARTAQGRDASRHSRHSKSAQHAQDVPWRKLTRQRARTLSALHYGFEMQVDRSARRLRAQQRIEFDLASPPQHALLIDWRPEDRSLDSDMLARSLTVNGVAAAQFGARLAECYLEIPACLLAAGRNRVHLADTTIATRL